MGDSVQAYDEFNDGAYFKEKWLWMPKRCHITNRWIWGKVVQGTRVWSTQNEVLLIEHRLYHRIAFISMRLRGEI